jgi:hypothetical protein
MSQRLMTSWASLGLALESGHMGSQDKQGKDVALINVGQINTILKTDYRFTMHGNII